MTNVSTVLVVTDFFICSLIYSALCDITFIPGSPLLYFELLKCDVNIVSLGLTAHGLNVSGYMVCHRKF